MNALDELLSRTADAFEQGLRDDPVAKAELTAACEQGRHPRVMRPLSDVRDCVVVIGAGKSEYA